jgi:dihydrofolate reductase
MRKAIAVMQTTLDGYIEGPNGELDWAMEDDEETWQDMFEFLDTVDACVLGRVMYPGYEQFWRAVLQNPQGPLPFTNAAAKEGEIEYAKWADRTPHYVVSKTLDRVDWKTTHIVRDLNEIRKLKEQPGKNIYVVGGATLVGSMMNAGLLDEVWTNVNPLIVGGGKAMFKDVHERRELKLDLVKQMRQGRVSLRYGVKTQTPLRAGQELAEAGRR